MSLRGSLPDCDPAGLLIDRQIIGAGRLGVGHLAFRALHRDRAGYRLWFFLQLCGPDSLVLCPDFELLRRLFDVKRLDAGAAAGSLQRDNRLRGPGIDVIRIGDRVVDSSIKTTLEGLKRELIA